MANKAATSFSRNLELFVLLPCAVKSTAPSFMTTKDWALSNVQAMARLRMNLFSHQAIIAVYILSRKKCRRAGFSMPSQQSQLRMLACPAIKAR